MKINTYQLKRWIPLVLLFFVLITLPNTSLLAATRENVDRDAVYFYLKTNHVHAGNLQKGSIDDMIKSLDDPYTQYFTQQEFDAFINQIDGTLVGVGIYLEEKNDYIVVLSPIKNSPAEKAGIEPGDKIIAVDGASVVGKPMNELTSLVRGIEGTKVSLTISRGNQELTFELTRAKIELPLVEYEAFKEEGIGYIHLTSFGDHTYPELVSALLEIEREGISSLILDLRGNPGGKISSVLDVASLFIGDGPVMWIKNGADQEDYYSVNKGNWWNKPLVILVDKGSASASEVLSGAIKDYHLATIIGDTTFGKGTMQSMIPLPSGSVLKLTTNEFFSPNKQTINKTGVAPDIRIEEKDDQLKAAKDWLKGANALLKGTGGITINAKNVDSIDDWALNKDGWYIALNRLHAMLGGELSWSQKDLTATYIVNGVTHKFTTVKDQLLIRKGRIYAPLSSLKGLPNLSVTLDADGNLQIKNK